MQDLPRLSCKDEFLDFTWIWPSNISWSVICSIVSGSVDSYAPSHSECLEFCGISVIFLNSSHVPSIVQPSFHLLTATKRRSKPQIIYSKYIVNTDGSEGRLLYQHTYWGHLFVLGFHTVETGRSINLWVEAYKNHWSSNRHVVCERERGSCCRLHVTR
jgi:hypothetical protein